MVKWASNHKKATGIPQPDKKFYRDFWHQIPEGVEEKIRSYVTEYVDEHMIYSSEEERFDAPLWRNHGAWEDTPIAYLYKAFENDEEACKRLFNLLFFEAFIKKDGTWYAGRSAEGSYEGISYFRSALEAAEQK